MTFFDLSKEPLEEGGRKAVDLLVEIFRELEQRAVGCVRPQGELADLFDGTVDDFGIGTLTTLEEFAEKVLPHSMGVAHPLYLGLVNSSPLPAAVLGDLLVSALNNNGGAFRQSPAASAAEAEVVRTFSRLFYGRGDASGLVLPGGSFGNLHGILLARTKYFPSWHKHGPTSLPGAPVIYVSDGSHFSVVRAAKVAGLGDVNLMSIPTRGRGAMDVQALSQSIRRDRMEGKKPFCVVATLGTTQTGAIDPLKEIAEVVNANDLWLHVDACYGGAALLLDDLAPRFEGIEMADSIAVDAHKWFFVPITAGLSLTRHPKLELELFDVAAASYIKGTEGTIDPYRRGMPTSRRCSGLVMWMALRAHGLGAVRDAVLRNNQLSRLIEERLRQRGFHVLEGGELSVACARWEPSGWDAHKIDQLQDQIEEHCVATGKAWFSTVHHAGKKWLRFNMVNLYTREHHIDALVDLVCDAVGELTRH